MSELSDALQRNTESLQRILDAARNLRSSINPLDRLERDDDRAWANAYLRNGLEELANVKSLVHDILTESNDVWAKHELLQAIAAVEVNLTQAFR